MTTKCIDSNVKTEVEFLATPNAWINNGLIVLTQKLKTEFGSQVNVNFNHEKVKIESKKNDEKLSDSICKALHNTAATGTYNFSTNLKLLNKELNAGYSMPKPYPIAEKDFDKIINITAAEKEVLKKRNRDPSKQQQVWKQRINFLSDKKNYLEKGLNLKTDVNFIRDLFSDVNGIMCPTCGSKTAKLLKVQQQFNPLTTEHHNNEIEGFNFRSMGRMNSQVCPRCILLCYFSVFDGTIPFFHVPQDDTYITIPNSVDLEILRKIHNNLSIPTQSIDFRDATCTSYASNIKSLFYRSKHACLLALLHNIKNEYTKTGNENLSMSFEEITREEFSEAIEWLFISKSFRIKHISADERIYGVLGKFKDPENNKTVYLVTDALCRVSFPEFDKNVMDGFFEGILKFDSEKISDGLFCMAKSSVNNSFKNIQRPIVGGSSPLLLLEKVFIPRLMEIGTMLKPELCNACGNLAKSVGKGFSKDIGMMTKFAYATNAGEFKEALGDALFRLAKKTALDPDESSYVSEESLKIMFDSIDSERFSDIKNYFVSFMSIAAISKNFKKQGSSQNGSTN